MGRKEFSLLCKMTFNDEWNIWQRRVKEEYETMKHNERGGGGGGG